MHSNLLTLGKKFHPGAHPSFLCIKHAMDGMLSITGLHPSSMLLVPILHTCVKRDKVE